MNKPTTTTSLDQRIPLKSLGIFLAITFGLAWGIIALFVFLPDLMTRLVGPLTGNHPMFFLAVYSPAIAALITIFRHAEIKGVRRFLTRMTYSECPEIWTIFILVGLPVVFYAGAALNGNLSTNPLPITSSRALVIAFALSAIKGPIEELGWRGYALPLLQRKMSPVWSALILGVIWGFWHLPAFMLNGLQQSAWSFAPFFAGTIAISLIATSLFNASRGSILVAAVFHFQLMNPIWPDARPYDTYLLLGVAALVLLFDRKAMFGRQAALTEIIPEARFSHAPQGEIASEEHQIGGVVSRQV